MLIILTLYIIDLPLFYFFFIFYIYYIIIF
nr:MAG TPA: hypothetical protein [Caudoviricetes sp.]